MSTKKNGWDNRALALGAIILGGLLCGYLLFRSVQLKAAAGTVPDLCAAVFGSSCDDILSSTLSWHLGFPLAGLGLMYFGLLGLLLSFRTLLFDRFVLVIAAFGLGVSVVQTKLLLGGGLSCPLCLVIHLLNLLVFVMIVLNVRRSFFTPGEQKPVLAGKRLAIWSLLLVGTLLVGGVSEVGALRASMNSQAPVDLDVVAAQFQSEKIYSIPTDEAMPIMGSPNAPVQLVVFSSFQCPACQSFAPTLEKLHEQFGDNVGITFKNFPLSTACNPRMGADMQPQACGAASAALAAHLQNGFWNYHDQLFDSPLTFDEASLVTMSQKSGLDVEQWQKDRQSEAVMQMIAEDVKLAYALEVNATPTVFINGRRVSSFQEPVLTFLIEKEVQQTLK